MIIMFFDSWSAARDAAASFNLTEDSIFRLELGFAFIVRE